MRAGCRQSGAQGARRPARARRGAQGRALSAREEHSGRGRPRRRLGRCGGRAAAARARQRSWRPTTRGWRRRRRRSAPTCRSASIRSARIMRGVGDELSAALDLPPLAALLVNPGVALATRDVFAGFAGNQGGKTSLADVPREREALIEWLGGHGNDLTPSRNCLRARHRRRAASLGRLAGRPARPHVGVGADLLCAVRVCRRGRRGGATAQGRAQGLVGLSHHARFGGKAPLKMPALQGTVVGPAICE